MSSARVSVNDWRDPDGKEKKDVSLLFGRLVARLKDADLSPGSRYTKAGLLALVDRFETRRWRRMTRTGEGVLKEFPAPIEACLSGTICTDAERVRSVVSPTAR